MTKSEIEKQYSAILDMLETVGCNMTEYQKIGTAVYHYGLASYDKGADDILEKMKESNEKQLEEYGKG